MHQQRRLVKGNNDESSDQQQRFPPAGVICKIATGQDELPSFLSVRRLQVEREREREKESRAPTLSWWVKEGQRLDGKETKSERKGLTRSMKPSGRREAKFTFTLSRSFASAPRKFLQRVASPPASTRATLNIGLTASR